MNDRFTLKCMTVFWTFHWTLCTHKTLYVRLNAFFTLFKIMLIDIHFVQVKRTSYASCGAHCKINMWSFLFKIQEKPVSLKIPKHSFTPFLFCLSLSLSQLVLKFIVCFLTSFWKFLNLSIICMNCTFHLYNM
jgi:hypothetical protein